MFDFPDEKLFMDAVHGYIRVPKCFVTHLIDTEMFQRLRNIDQTGMRILYPNAKHDRFSHSLGVFHLGCAAVDTLLENFSHAEYWKISSDHTSLTFWAKNKALFLIACLLHDIGHAPFSHSLEGIILKNSPMLWEETAETAGEQACDEPRKTAGEQTGEEPAEETANQKAEYLPDYLMRKLHKLEGGAEPVNRSDAAAHEYIGALYIITHMRNAIEAVLDDLIARNYPVVGTGNILYAEHYKYNPRITKDDLDGDIAFIARMILGLKYTGYQPEKQIRNCFIELLNGGNFDVDKLDYVIRDTKMSGISNISIDIARLLGALCIVSKTRYTNKCYQNNCLSNRGILRLSNNQGDLTFRLQGKFRGTILLKKDAEVTIRRNSTFLSLLPLGHGKLKYADTAEAARFNPDTILFQDGLEMDQTYGTPPYKALEPKNRTSFDFRIENATVLSDDFHFVACSGSSGGDAAELRVNGYCDIEIRGCFTTKSTMKAFQVTLSGHLREMVLLGDMMERQVPDESVYNEFSVGFKKQAINVIANVLEARDYLYLWIYAHHKVIYYANFLLPIVSQEILGNVRPDDGTFPMWPLDFDHLEMLDDAYIWTAVKYCRTARRDADPELLRLCEDLLSRRYRLSLYKSLAEFDLLFEAIPPSKRLDIKTHLLDQRHTRLPWLENKGSWAGYLSEDFLNTLKKRTAGLDGILDLVYVDSGYKPKRLKAEETFIVASDGAVASLDEISLLYNRAAPSANMDYYYFYLYYRTNTTTPEAREAEAAALRGAIRDFFIERLSNGTPRTRGPA